MFSGGFLGHPSALRRVMHNGDKSQDAEVHDPSLCGDLRKDLLRGWLTSNWKLTGKGRLVLRRIRRQPEVASGWAWRVHIQTWKVRFDICMQLDPRQLVVSLQPGPGNRTCMRTSSHELSSWCFCRNSTWNKSSGYKIIKTGRQSTSAVMQSGNLIEK